MMTDERICALRKMLIADGYPTAYNDVVDGCADNFYECDNGEYMVLDEGEVYDMATENIKEMIGSFNSWFLADHSILEYDTIVNLQESGCGQLDEIILQTIDDIEVFVDDAICEDGAAHFLGTYDGDEYESGDYFIYRVN